RSKKDAEQKAKKSRSGLLNTFLKKSNSQGGAQAIVGVFYMFFLLFPSIMVLPIGIIVVMVSSGNIPGVSIKELLELNGGAYNALGIFLPGIAGMYNISIPFFKWQLPGVIGFPVFYGVMTYCLFLQARYYLVV